MGYLPADGYGTGRNSERTHHGAETDYNNTRARSAFRTARRALTAVAVPCLLVVCLFPGSARSNEYFHYLPSPADSETTPVSTQGILVKKITIRRGDTLSAISRHYAGKSRYYPQILLFNRISNPNLIIAGKELLVPVSGRNTDRAHSAGKQDPGPSHSVRQRSGAGYRTAEKRPSSAEENLYAQAVALLAKGEYRRAADGFSLFLKKYPDSPLSPDAHLQRADCYLRLSGRNDSSPE